MADVLTPEQRKRCMSNIKGKDTKPEILVRHIVHSMGFRYRLHRTDLPGKPDMVFSARRKVIFIHGCFWHMHNCKFGNVKPKTNAEFWQQKRAATVSRDESAINALEADGWSVLVVWECETKSVEILKSRLMVFLGNNDVKP